MVRKKKYLFICETCELPVTNLTSYKGTNYWKHCTGGNTVTESCNKPLPVEAKRTRVWARDSVHRGKTITERIQ